MAASLCERVRNKGIGRRNFLKTLDINELDVFIFGLTVEPANNIKTVRTKLLLLARLESWSQGHPPFFLRLPSNAFPDTGEELGEGCRRSEPPPPLLR